MKNHEEILKKYTDSSRIRKSKFQKILKILRGTFRKIWKKCKLNFEEIRRSKKIDIFKEMKKVIRILYQEILVRFVINFGKPTGNFCQDFKRIL